MNETSTTSTRTTSTRTTSGPAGSPDAQTVAPEGTGGPRRYAIGFSRAPRDTTDTHGWAVVADDGRIAVGGSGKTGNTLRLLQVTAQLLNWGVDVDRDIIYTTESGLQHVKWMEDTVRKEVRHYTAAYLTEACAHWETYLDAVDAPNDTHGTALAYIAGRAPDRACLATMAPAAILNSITARMTAIDDAATPDNETFVGRRVGTDASVTSQGVAIAWVTPWETHAEQIETAGEPIDADRAEELAILAAFDAFADDAVVEVITDSQRAAHRLTRILEADDLHDIFDPHNTGKATTDQLHTAELLRWRIGVGREGIISRRVIWMPRCSNNLLQRADNAARECRRRPTIEPRAMASAI